MEKPYQNVFEILKKRITSREAVVGIIGLGYIGLPLAHAFYTCGVAVIGFDTDSNKIDMLEKGESYLHHLGKEMFNALAETNLFEGSSDFTRLNEADVIIVCVPTPLGAHQEPDLSYVLNTAKTIGKSVRVGQLIILESTTYPRTTRDEFLPIVLRSAEERGVHLTPGENVFAAFSPEREDPGRKDITTAKIPKLVGGLDPKSTELAVELYSMAISKIVQVETAEIAESAKLLENIFRAVNIALVNEMKIILNEMGIDVWEVIRAADTKPFGFLPFYPGPGLGGHCIPIDPFYLTWKAREVGRPTRFIQLAGEINTSMPHYVVEQLASSLNKSRKSLAGSEVLVIGLSYKPDVDDTRESPAFEIIKLLMQKEVRVSYHDPHVPVAPQVRKHSLNMESVEITDETVKKFDAVMIITNHSSINYSLIAKHAQMVIDTRDAMRPFSAEMGNRLVRA